MTALLALEGVVAGYGRGDVLRGVDLTIEDGAITCLIGPNGAGKSTVLKTVSGLLRPKGGTILLRGEPIGGRTPQAILERGVVHVTLVLMDEPSTGLDPKARRRVFEAITEVNRAGRTVLLVEQNARSGLAIADHGAVMDSGVVRLTGTGADLLVDPEVARLYLGTAGTNVG